MELTADTTTQRINTLGGFYATMQMATAIASSGSKAMLSCYKDDPLAVVAAIEYANTQGLPLTSVLCSVAMGSARAPGPYPMASIVREQMHRLRLTVYAVLTGPHDGFSGEPESDLRSCRIVGTLPDGREVVGRAVSLKAARQNALDESSEMAWSANPDVCLYLAACRLFLQDYHPTFISGRQEVLGRSAPFSESSIAPPRAVRGRTSGKAAVPPQTVQQEVVSATAPMGVQEFAEPSPPPQLPNEAVNTVKSEASLDVSQGPGSPGLPAEGRPRVTLIRGAKENPSVVKATRLLLEASRNPSVAMPDAVG